tara:strand:- start:10 stop:543 length:534 start_codon:yes stop_codon:yes gene_type:complete
MGLKFGKSIEALPQFVWAKHDAKSSPPNDLHKTRPRLKFDTKFSDVLKRLKGTQHYKVFSLKPGTYFLWQIVLKDGHVDSWLEPKPTVSFRVNSGEAHYIGQFFLDQNPLSRKITFSSLPEVQKSNFEAAQAALAKFAGVSMPLKIEKVDSVSYDCTGTAFMGIGDRACKLTIAPRS